MIIMLQNDGGSNIGCCLAIKLAHRVGGKKTKRMKGWMKRRGKDAVFDPVSSDG